MSKLHMMDEIKRQEHLEKTIESVDFVVENCCEAITSRGKNAHFIITGSGDSYYIGLAVKPFFESCCPHARIEVLSSMDFARYGLSRVDETTTVIAISISGNVVRTIECVTQAQQKGAFVIGITNNKESTLYKIAERPFFLNLDTEPTWTCGTLTYVGSLYTLYRIAAQLCEEGRAKREALLSDIHATVSLIPEVLKRSEEICKKAARNMRIINNKPPIFVLGAGPNYATAKYGAAKFAEVCSTLAIGQECEEFCHCEFWVVRRDNIVCLAAPSGGAYSRCNEVYDALRTFGCDLFVLSDHEELCAKAKFAVNMPSCGELYTPMLYALPFQLLAYYYSYELGLNPDTREHTDPFRKHCSRMLTRGKDMEL